MTGAEQAIYARTQEIAALAHVDLTRRRADVLISETMRLSERGDPVLGIWEAEENRIVIRRDRLNSLSDFAGTLLHEIGHMVSRTHDGTLDFETELSRLLGMTAAAALGDRAGRLCRRSAGSRYVVISIGMPICVAMGV